MTDVALDRIAHAVARANRTLASQADGGQVFVRQVQDGDLRVLAHAAREAVDGRGDPRDPVQAGVAYYMDAKEAPGRFGRALDKVFGPQGDVRTKDVDLALRVAQGEIQRADAAPPDGVVDAGEQRALSPLALRLLAYAKKDDAQAARPSRSDGTVVAAAALVTGTIVTTTLLR